MSNSVNLKKAGTFYLVGTLFNKGIGFVTTPIFTRILSKADFGTITTYNSWVSMLSIVFSLALYMGIRAAFVDHAGKEHDVCSTVTTFNLIYGAVITGVAILVVNVFSINIDQRVLVCCLVQSVMMAVIENYLIYLMMTYNYKLRTAFMILPNLIATLVSIVLILFVFDKEQFLGRIYASTILHIIFASFALVLIHRKSRVWNKQYLTYCLKISLPLVLHGISLSVLSQSDRTMITSIRSNEETALYGLVYNYSMVATVLTTAFDGIWIPWFTQRMKDKEYDSINKVSQKYIGVVAVLLSMVVLVGPEVVKILAPKSYWESIVIIPALVFSNFVIFAYTFYVNVEHFYKKTGFISVNTCIAAGSNILLNIFFIKWFGYKGAAYTTLISYVISLGLHMLYSKKLNREVFPVRNFIFPCATVIACLVVFYLFMNVLWVRWLAAIAIMALTIYLERNTILSYFKKGKK